VIAAAELAAQRLMTKHFVEADVAVITLVRSEWVDDGAGGSVRSDPVSLPPQRMRLIPLGNGSSSQAERFTSTGEQVQPSYKLLGLHTADMERWDEFTLGGTRYEIVWVDQNRQYEVKGEVAYRG
jgi:hypothetical protein